MVIINGISSAVSTRACGIEFATGSVAAAKFLDDGILLILWTCEGNDALSLVLRTSRDTHIPRPDDTPRLLAVPVKSPGLSYVDYNEGDVPTTRKLHRNEALAAFWSAEIRAGAGFTPIRMEVVGPNGSRGKIPARVCLLGSDLTSYKVFALPAASEMSK